MAGGLDRTLSGPERLWQESGRGAAWRRWAPGLQVEGQAGACSPEGREECPEHKGLPKPRSGPHGPGQQPREARSGLWAAALPTSTSVSPLGPGALRRRQAGFPGGGGRRSPLLTPAPPHRPSGGPPAPGPRVPGRRPSCDAPDHLQVPAAEHRGVAHCCRHPHRQGQRSAGPGQGREGSGGTWEGFLEEGTLEVCLEGCMAI